MYWSPHCPEDLGAQMTCPIHTVARKFDDCHPTEIDDFMALVLAGNAVESQGLRERIRRAEALIFLTVGCCLCGVAGLKNPDSRYRAGLASKSKISLPVDRFPYELGWVFVMPSARGRRFSVDLVRAALSASSAAGVFATTRSPEMAQTLARFEFVPAGKPWLTARDPNELQLFLRHAAEPAAATDAAKGS